MRTSIVRAIEQLDPTVQRVDIPPPVGGKCHPMNPVSATLSLLGDAVLACSTSDREVVGSSPAGGCVVYGSNRAPVALRTLGLGLLNHPLGVGK